MNTLGPSGEQPITIFFSFGKDTHSHPIDNLVALQEKANAFSNDLGLTMHK